MTEFDLNGKKATFDAPAEMPLLWVLRDLAQLTGTKFGCGLAQCGACTVHVDGRPLRACVTPLSAVAGKRVTTIEGLAASGTEHPVQRAWQELDVRRSQAPLRIDTHFLENPAHALTALGEPALPVVAPALANALARLTGVRPRTLPLRIT